MARLRGIGGYDTMGGVLNQDFMQPVDAPPMQPDAEMYPGGSPDFYYGREDGTGIVDQDRPPVDPPTPDYGTGQLEGFNADKLANEQHRLKSPKYAFADVFGNYGNTREGFEAGFKELQEKYPDFFGNWQLEGDDSIKWSGEGQLHDAFMGHDNFDVWRNASGEGGSTGWQWETNRSDLLPQQGGAQANPMQMPTGGPSTWGGSGGSSGFSGSFSGGGSGQSWAGSPNYDQLQEVLSGFFPDGAFNQGVVNANLDNARGALERGRRSRLATSQAALANRGLIGDGPESTAMQNIDEDTYDMYTEAVNDIYSNESEQASNRMMQALSLATGMTIEQASQVIDQFRAQTDRDLGNAGIGLGYHRAGIDERLGLGNLAIGNMRAVNDYNLGLGGLNLGYNTLGANIASGNDDRMLELLRLYLSGADTSNDGYI